MTSENEQRASLVCYPSTWISNNAPAHSQSLAVGMNLAPPPPSPFFFACVCVLRACLRRDGHSYEKVCSHSPNSNGAHILTEIISIFSKVYLHAEMAKPELFKWGVPGLSPWRWFLCCHFNSVRNTSKEDWNSLYKASNFRKLKSMQKHDKRHIQM